jgi:hypothetical protein
MTDTKTVLQIPANFRSVVFDFTNDLSNTFPEFAFLWKKWTNPNLLVEDVEDLFMYFTKVFPERFFDILYQNDDIFKTDSEANTAFLPNVDFKLLYNCTNITENTKKAIWKYLQLILISVIGSIQNKNTFGDAANLFEGLDENVIHSKLNETIDEISNFFKNLGSNSEASKKTTESSEMPDLSQMDEEFQRAFSGQTTDESGQSEMPNAENIHKHLQGLFDGKIGSLAKELAEEITTDMQNLFQKDGGLENVNSTQDILKQMLKNPKKMMDLMKTIGDKLQTKMKSGEITEEELMKEATELMGKMKGMGGGKGGFADIMKNMAQGMLGKNARFNSNAFSNMEKKMTAKERMRSKLEQKRQDAANATAQKPNIQFSLQPTNEPNSYEFSLPEEAEQEKTTLSSAPVAEDVLPDVDTLAAEIENIGAKTSSGKSKKGKKGKK